MTTADAPTDLLSRIERAAAEATPGPWTVLAANAVNIGEPDDLGQKCAFFEGGNPTTDIYDAAFIALCDPTTIARMVRIVRAARDFFHALDKGYPLTPNLGAVRTALSAFDDLEAERAKEETK